MEIPEPMRIPHLVQIVYRLPPELFPIHKLAYQLRPRLGSANNFFTFKRRCVEDRLWAS